jgi:hypothetical protein
MNSEDNSFKCKGTDEDWEKYLNKLREPRGNKRIIFSRFVSYDFCYNYFQDFYVNNKIEDIASKANLNLSCLHLGFYLASWGMYRGKSAQSRMSYRIYEEVIKKIAYEQELWKYDVNDYSDENKCERIIKFEKEIQELLSKCFIQNNGKGKASETLATKIMLGTFGCVPALDFYFRKFIEHATLNDDTLKRIHCCYLKHQKLIDECQIKTLDEDRCETQHKYKKARLIDYVGFCIGEEYNSKKQKPNSNLQK